MHVLVTSHVGSPPPPLGPNTPGPAVTEQKVRQPGLPATAVTSSNGCHTGCQPGAGTEEERKVCQSFPSSVSPQMCSSPARLAQLAETNVPGLLPACSFTLSKVSRHLGGFKKRMVCQMVPSACEQIWRPSPANATLTSVKALGVFLDGTCAKGSQVGCWKLRVYHSFPSWVRPQTCSPVNRNTIKSLTQSAL